jgi:hypothetical protein
MNDTPRYDAMQKAVSDFYSHVDEMFAEIDAIEERGERLKTLVALIFAMKRCEYMLRSIRRRAFFALARFERKGFRVPGQVGRRVRRFEAQCTAFAKILESSK